MTGEGCAVLQVFISEGGDMFVPPLFEVYCASHIVFLFSLQYLGVVNNVFLIAVVFDRALVFLGWLAVASTPLFLVVLLVDNLTVLCFLDLRHVFHAAVRDFYSISV